MWVYISSIRFDLEEMQRVRNDLLGRGYPKRVLEKDLPYDNEKRKALLQKMKDRTFQQKKTHDDGKIIIKIPFVKGIRKLRLQKHYKKMVASLRTLTKSSFLDDLRMVIAHPVVQNSFLETYRLNFVPKV